MYLCDGEIVGSKYILFVYDNELDLKWYYYEISEKQVNPIFIKSGNSMVLEYGEPNLFQVRQKIPFVNENGELEKKWIKIK